MSIPIVFWLVLTLGYANNYNSNTIVMPVPFSSEADCDTAGESWVRKNSAFYICLQQRRSDIEGFQGHPMNYHEIPQ